MNLLRKAEFQLTICCILAVVSCAGENYQAPEFDGNRAYEYLVDQVEFGPRVPGSMASSSCRSYFYSFFRELGFPVDSQAFDYFDSYSRKNVAMVNVIASCAGHGADDRLAVVLMAHYDCRPRADYAGDPTLRAQPIDGANDGASGIAVLMEMANLFKVQPPPCRGIWFSSTERTGVRRATTTRI